METEDAYQWVRRSPRRRKALLQLTQPLTAKHLARRTGLSTDVCRYLFGEFFAYAIIYCLNNEARRSRLYWLTKLGKAVQLQLTKEPGQSPLEHSTPNIDWPLFGWVCYNHRSAVIRQLTEPMQPAEIKRRVRNHQPEVRISANNVRDIIYLFLEKGIVQPVQVRRKAHRRYELTDQGKEIQRLLNQAHWPAPSSSCSPTENDGRQ